MSVTIIDARECNISRIIYSLIELYSIRIYLKTITPVSLVNPEREGKFLKLRVAGPKDSCLNPTDSPG